MILPFWRNPEMLVPRNVFQYCRDFRIFPQIIKWERFVHLKRAKSCGHWWKLFPTCPLKPGKDSQDTKTKSVWVMPQFGNWMGQSIGRVFELI
jgi:hypothetical protein